MQNVDKERKVTKRIFIPIRDGNANALKEMKEFHKISDWRKSYPESIEYSLGLEVSKNKRKDTEGKKGERQSKSEEGRREALFCLSRRSWRWWICPQPDPSHRGGNNAY